jgi:poly-gamma-glutamate synthesis protein (capsule biosynthesis protein)
LQTKKLLLILAIITLILASGGYITQQSPEVVSGVVPHHLLARDVIESFFKYTSNKSSPKTVILLSPDHFHQCVIFGVDFISAKGKNFMGNDVDTTLIEALSKDFNIMREDPGIGTDHGITNIIPFIRESFPQAKIAPFLVSLNMSIERTKSFTEALNMLTGRDTLVIASVDFSHYLPEAVADFHDIKSVRTLINFDEGSFNNLDVDSPQSLYTARYFAFLRGAENYHLVAHKNAQDYTKEIPVEETTSYVSVTFEKGNIIHSLPVEESKTLLFTGDIMLDRGVEKLIDKYNLNYPFEKIKNALKGTDFVVGNLEGPISANPVEFDAKSLKFCFRKEVASVIKDMHFNVLSLANNHAYDLGYSGLAETRSILRSAGIATVGDSLNIESSTVLKEDDIVFIAFNLIQKFNEGEILKIIRKTRQQNPTEFIVLILHWGEEYSPHSYEWEQILAHHFIDNGADLIIGTHPHVVQDIELYHSDTRNKDALIFYSLGNFIFDQYFSGETQEGLMVALEISKDAQKYTLIPVKLPTSQSQLMNFEEKESFLRKLSEKSSNNLKNKIKEGIINIQS